jgi:tetratricopeptide (TPR) repeat protein
MPPSPKSLQEILKQRQRSDFVGREDYLSAFGDNLKLPLESPRRRFLFNVWGQGGVGKSTLLKQFSKAAQEARAAVAYTDESEASVPEAMGRMAKQFTDQGYKLNQFTDRYRLYRQRKQELETDPEAPQGFSALMGKTAAKVSIRLGRRVPVGGAVLDCVDEDVLSNQAAEWAAYVTRKLRNKDEVQLVQDPIAVLTPLFLQDLRTLAQQAPIALFFDTYEQTGDFLDPWLRQLLEGKHSDVPPNIVITIAGRHALDSNHWVLYDDVTARFPLEPFTDEEAEQYLHRKGITDAKVVEVILHLSGRLPLLVATLAAGSPHSPNQVGEPSDTAVERFLKWVEDPRQRQIALAAALPRRFNRDIIAELSTEEEADTLFAWLKTMPFVKEQRDGWVYHQVVRTLMLRYQRLSSPKNWEAAQGQLAAYFDQCRDALKLEDDQQERDPDWQDYRLEALYHGLCGAPRAQLKAAINDFLAALKNQPSFAARWAEIMEQAGQNSNSQSLQAWGQQLVVGLRAYQGDKYSVTLGMFTQLLKDFMLEPRWRCVALAWRGDAHRLMGSFEDALQDLDEALEIEGGYGWAIATRGLTYRRMERYDEALADFNHAIELKPNVVQNFVNRGLTYRLIERYEEALTDFNRAIELKPNDARNFANRGLTYRLMERYEEALVDFNGAIELDTKYSWAIANRGETYRQMERYDEALTDLTRAIELKLGYEWAFASRGMTYLKMERYDEALVDLTRAIELKPDDEGLIASRGVAYCKLKQPSLAEADFQKAIQLVQEELQIKPGNIQCLFNLAVCYLANNQFDLSRQTYQQSLKLGANLTQIREAVQDLSEFLKLFPGHSQAIAFHKGLRKKLEEASSNRSRKT